MDGLFDAIASSPIAAVLVKNKLFLAMAKFVFDLFGIKIKLM